MTRLPNTQTISLTRRMTSTRTNVCFFGRKMKEELLALGWVDKGDVLVRYGTPRLGWKPTDGTLIIGYHEWPEKVKTINEIKKVIDL